MNHPRYSIIMPAFNAQATIAKAMASVQGQTIDNWEIIAVDDGSSDRTLSILEDFCKSDNRIRVFSQENRGPGAARRLALENCGGEYVAFLDSDDYWEPDFLKRVDEQFVSNNSDVVFVDVIDEGIDGSPIGRTEISANRGLSKECNIRRQMTGLIPWGMEKAFRRSLLSDLCGGFSDLDVGEEAIFSFEVVNAASAISFVDKPIYHYVKRECGQHKKGGDDPWRQVVRSMSNHLDARGELERYKATVNAFALRAMCIAVYRLACRQDSLSKASKAIALLHKQYEAEFDLDQLDKGALDKTSLLIRMLLRARCYWALVLVSRARRKRLPC